MEKAKKPIRGGMANRVAELARLFKSSKAPSGAIILFAGPAGSGKTKAVKALAAQIGLDIYRVDLGAMLNKYIGETEKNLAGVLDKAEARDVILFFDEADALLGKRTEVRDAHDRYTNVETNYLLQRIEKYTGLVILTTNSRKNLDEAILCRVRSVVEFPLSSE